MSMIWSIPVLPMLAAISLLLGREHLSRRDARRLALATLGGALLVAAGLSYRASAGSWSDWPETQIHTLYTWIEAGGFSVDVALYLDPLSAAAAGAVILSMTVALLRAGRRSDLIVLSTFASTALFATLAANFLLVYVAWVISSWLVTLLLMQNSVRTAFSRRQVLLHGLGDLALLSGIVIFSVNLGTLRVTGRTANQLPLSTTALVETLIIVGLLLTGMPMALALYRKVADGRRSHTRVWGAMAAILVVGGYLSARIFIIMG